jgi:hypothetical protein
MSSKVEILLRNIWYFNFKFVAKLGVLMWNPQGEA